MKALFTILVYVDKPVVIGQDGINGRRQLIPITAGELSGVDIYGNPMRGTVLPGGVDSQVIRPDGKCELSARYGVKLEDGRSFYIENNGIRTVPGEYVQQVLSGGFVDPSLYYFATTPHFEVYHDSLRWMENYIFVCKAIRTPTAVELHYYIVN